VAASPSSVGIKVLVGIELRYLLTFHISRLSLVTPLTAFQQTNNYMAHKPSSRPFAPPRTHNLTSDNPRTIQNRNYRLAKRGLELAEYRDNGAFRTQKSRALKRFCTSDGWVNMSPVEQEEAEEEVIH